MKKEPQTIKLLKDLPFISKGNILTKILPVTSRYYNGWGFDRGTTHYKEGGSSHNGIQIFDDLENRIINRMVKQNNERWIKILDKNQN